MAARPFSASAIIPEFLGRRVRSRGGCWSKLRRDAQRTLHHYGTGERSATQFRKFLGESQRPNSLKTNRVLPVDALRFGTRCARPSGGEGVSTNGGTTILWASRARFPKAGPGAALQRGARDSGLSGFARPCR